MLGEAVFSFAAGRVFCVGAALLAATAAAMRANSAETTLRNLDEAIMVRLGPHGERWGVGETDPLVWELSEVFRSGDSRDHLRSALREVLALSESNIKHCPPAQRALVQNRAWAIFSYLFDHWRHRPMDENRATMTLLAEVVGKLELDDAEIRSLPDPLSAAVRAQTFRTVADAAGGPDIFLPPDVISDASAWRTLVREDGELAARIHARSFDGRSLFIIRAKFPAGDPSAEVYFASLAASPRPWIEDPMFPASTPGPNAAPPRYILNPELPTLPPGTELALVRTLAVIDRQGRWRATPLVLTVQLRHYIRTAPRRGNDPFAQTVAEFRLKTDQVAGGGAAVLRAVSADETNFMFFSTVGADEVDAMNEPGPRDRTTPACLNCHFAAGLGSVHSIDYSVTPPAPLALLKSGDASLEAARASAFTATRPDWAELTRMLGSR